MALADTFYIKQFLGWDIILVTAGSLFSFNWSLIFVISACYAIVVVVSAVAMLKIKVSAVFSRGFWLWLPYTNVCISDRYSIFIFAIKSFVKRVLLYEILALFSVSCLLISSGFWAPFAPLQLPRIYGLCLADISRCGRCHWVLPGSGPGQSRLLNNQPHIADDSSRSHSLQVTQSSVGRLAICFTSALQVGFYGS